MELRCNCTAEKRRRRQQRRRLLRCIVAHESKAKKNKSPSLLRYSNATKEKKTLEEGDGSCRRLIRCFAAA
jgi:hypothetical protein